MIDMLLCAALGAVVGVVGTLLCGRGPRLLTPSVIRLAFIDGNTVMLVVPEEKTAIALDRDCACRIARDVLERLGGS